MEEDEKQVHIKIEVTESNCKRVPNYGRDAILFASCGIFFGGIPYFGVLYIALCFFMVIRAFRQRFSMEALFAAIIVAIMAVVKYIYITTF